MIDQILELLDAATQQAESSERALYYLLMEYKKWLPPLETYADLGSFQAWFRKTDVTDSGFVDMAIWNLLNCSKIFWDVCEEVLPPAESKPL